MRKCLSWVLLCPLVFFAGRALGQSANSQRQDSLVRSSKRHVYHGSRPIGKVLEGIASYYGERFRGRRTHTDDIFDPDKMTAACNQLPLKTWVKVTNLRNHRSVNVWINDRMHPKNKRLIDVSSRAAKELGFYARGLTRVKIEVIPPP